MIKSKIDARERALELAVKSVSGKFTNIGITLEYAKSFADFLIGDAELPEFVSGVDDMLEAFEVMKKQLPEFNKSEDISKTDFLLPAPQDRKLMTESEAERFKALLIERGYTDEGCNIILGCSNKYKKSFDNYDLYLYINKRVGGYIASPTVNIGEGVDAPRFTLPDYDLDIERIESAARKVRECYWGTIN